MGDLQPILDWLNTLGPWGAVAALALVVLWPKLSPHLPRLPGKPDRPKPDPAPALPPDLLPDNPRLRVLLLLLLDYLRKKHGTHSDGEAIDREVREFLRAEALEKPSN